MNKRIFKILIGLAALIAMLVFSLLGRYQGRYQAAIQSKTEYVRVVEVNDGDTITVILEGRKERVRLIGIDAPELHQRPWGQRAKRHLQEMLNASQWTVSLEFDIEKRDQYGRLLGYIWTSDRWLINVRMLKDGYAMLFTVPPNIRYVDKFKKAQDEARGKSLGIWGKRGLKETPREYRKEHPRL